MIEKKKKKWNRPVNTTDNTCSSTAALELQEGAAKRVSAEHGCAVMFRVKNPLYLSKKRHALYSLPSGDKTTWPTN
jgi:hypothetical protein